MMRLLRLGILTQLCSLLVASTAWCVSWTIPNNIKFVQPTGSGTYQTIQLALASITDASSTNRYLIKVTPGTYTATSTSPIIMKQFVDIEGSGPENTIITSTIDIGVDDALWGPTPSTAGTLVVPADINGTTGGTVSLRSVTVKNASSTGGIAILALGHVNLENVSATASGNPTLTDRDYCALAAEGSVASVSVHGGVFEVSNQNTNARVVAAGAFHGGHLTIRDADIKASGGAWTVALAAIPRLYAGTVEASSCALLIDDVAYGGWTLDVNESNVGTVQGSKLTVLGTLGGICASYGTAASISQSQLFGSSAVESGGAFASSMVDTPYGATTKIVHCWDAGFNPLVNQ